MSKEGFVPLYRAVAEPPSRMKGRRGVRTTADVIMEHFEAFTRKEWERFAGCFSEDVKLYAGLATLTLQARGRERIRQLHREFFDQYEDPEFQLTAITCQANRAAVEYHWRATEKATGRRMGVQRMEVFEVENGYIREVRVYSLPGFQELPPPRRRRFQALFEM